MAPTEKTDLREFHNYAPWVNVVLGFGVFVLRYASPRGTFSVHWNLFITGIVIMFVALAATISHGNSPRNYWSAINVLTGAWLLISAETIPSIHVVMWSQQVLGVLIIVIAIASQITEIIAQRKIAERSHRTL